jgi:transposase
MPAGTGSGNPSPWVSRHLARFGYEVIVTNARRVRLISESSRKDDKLDAKTLVRLARIDPQLLSPIRHRSEQAQADLTMVRARAVLVEARTALINGARGLTKSYGERVAELRDQSNGARRGGIAQPYSADRA